MRIAFFAKCFPPEVGGVERYNVEFARRLHGRGHALDVFVWEERPSAESPAVDGALPFRVRRQPVDARARRTRPDGIAAFLRDVRPEVAFISRASRKLPLAVAAVAREVPVVLSVHELRQRHENRWFFQRLRVRRRYGLPWAARVVVNSADTRARVLALGVPEERVRTVHPGVDVAEFRERPEAGATVRRELGLAGRPVLLTVARLAENKGHALVIDVLPALRERFPGVVYLIVGGGGLREALEERAAARGVADAVRFTGRVADVRPYYHACDIFVMPSSPPHAGSNAGEGFGIGYVEAGACGKPVVASTSGGGAEIVVDRETGRLVPPNDRPALEAALRGLLDDPAAAGRMGEAGRARAEGYDWARGVVALEAALEEAARDRVR